MKDAVRHAEGLLCQHCNHVTFFNSVAVAVLIAPYVDHVSGRENGVFIQKRGIDPVGEWALISGYVMQGETWQAAACREACEEIQIVCRHEDVEAERPKLLLVENSSTRKQIIIVSTVQAVYRVEDFVPTDEVLERDVLFPDDERQLCFPIHRKALAMYWEALGVPHKQIV